MPRSKKGLGGCHKIGTGNNQGRPRTTVSVYWGFIRKEYHSKSIEMSLPVIYVSITLNNSVINPPQLSLVCHQSSRSSHRSPHENECLDSNHIKSKGNDPCLLSEHNHQVILEKIEAREDLNHGEYVEEEDYYNDDSDKSDIDAN